MLECGLRPAVFVELLLELRLELKILIASLGFALRLAPVDVGGVSFLPSLTGVIESVAHRRQPGLGDDKLALKRLGLEFGRFSDIRQVRFNDAPLRFKQLVQTNCVGFVSLVYSVGLPLGGLEARQDSFSTVPSASWHVSQCPPAVR